MAFLCCTSLSSLHVHRVLSLRAIGFPATVKRGLSKMMPFSSMPGPKGTIPNILGYMFGKGSHFEIVSNRFKKFGPIYRERILGMQIVNIYDVDAVTEVLRTETNFQMRPGLEAVIDVFGGRGTGIISNDYEQWYPDRSLLSPMMLRPKEVKKRLPIINDVADDFVERLDQIKNPDGIINNIDEELSYWSVEANTSFLFKRRLGFYNNPQDPAALVFYDAALKLILNAGILFHSGPFYKYIPIPAYNTMKKNADIMNKSYIEMFNKVTATTSEDVAVADCVFAERDFTPESRTIICGLMAAGVDTTSTTTIWLLYLLSRNPDVQEKLYQEIRSQDKISIDNPPSYLKAALKESQRLYPVASILSRVFNQDIELHGYHIPAGVNIMFQNHLSSTDEANYGEDAKSFVPERWLREAETGKRQDFNPFCSLPFGYGVRMCLGRRIAEVFIYTLIRKILMKYKVEFAGETDVERIMKGGNMKPDREILIKFLSR